MKTSDISAKCAEKYMKIISEDRDTLNFIWSISDDYVEQISGGLFPDGTKNPLMYLLENGFIAPESHEEFEVFCAQIEQGIAFGTEHKKLVADINMRILPEKDFERCHVYALFLLDENSRITDINFNIRPFSEREYFESDIARFTSDMDPSLYTRRMAKLIKRIGGKNLAFIQFDVERFKMINEAYGEQAGDELLEYIRRSLGMICTEDQPFTRLTADVFMIVTPFKNKQEIIDFIHRLEALLSFFHGMEYRFSFGVAIADEISGPTRIYGDNATIARRSVKGNAMENICFYNDAMRNDLHKEKYLEDEMQNALLNNEFVMYLQPKYSISANRIIGAEALTRWISPEKGMISPADFIPLFEKNGFIVKLDRFIWEEACRKIRSWIDKGIAPVPISVNISREYLHSFDVVEYISELVKKYNIPKHYLELEITESAESSGVEGIVSRLKDAGFTMLMDDFGSGYSSLNMLKTTRFDVLKIDRDFLSEFMESDRGRKIIAHTISMSHDIGLDIIAEGVETTEQAHFLSVCGCDAAQGFLYSRPLSQKDFDEQFEKVNK